MKNRWWMNLIRCFIDGGGLLCILRPFIHVITGLAKGEMSLTEFYRTAIVLAWLSITWDHCIIRHSLRCFRHSGLVIYMSKLPAPSVSMPCDYRILQSPIKEHVKLVLLWGFSECGFLKALRLKAKEVYSCKWPSLNVDNNVASAAQCNGLL